LFVEGLVGLSFAELRCSHVELMEIVIATLIAVIVINTFTALAMVIMLRSFMKRVVEEVRKVLEKRALVKQVNVLPYIAQVLWVMLISFTQ
jgi:hypothetical protein